VISLIFERTEGFISLPVSPESIEIKIPGSNKKTDIVSLGEIVVLREPGLASFNVSSFFPAAENPQGYIRFITNWRKSKTHARFIIGSLNINMLVAIEDFSYEHRAGEEQDIYYTLSLTEYRPYGAEIMSIDVETNTAAPVTETRVDNSGAVEQTYTVVSGDNLGAIARRLSGSWDNWRELYEANKAVIGDNYSLIYPGQILVIPQGWVTAT